MRRLFVFPAFLFFSACGAEIPSDVIPSVQMEKIVWELIQADELAMQNKTGDSSINLKKESFRLYDQVFSLNKTSREKFNKSYRWYQEHPAHYKQMMTAIKEKADKEKRSLVAPVTQ